jgi:hypothetical protein
MHPKADLAVGVAAPMQQEGSGGQLTNGVCVLTEEIPAIGSPVATYAFPNCVNLAHSEGQRIEMWPTFYDGKVVEYYPAGRDRVLLPGPCYRTTTVIHSGASGGPVFGITGQAFGVNSTGWEGEPESFISPVHQIMDLSIDDVILLNETEPRTVGIAEMVKLGHVIFYPPLRF